MKCSRRDFLKMAGGSALFLTLGELGINLEEAFAYARGINLEGCKEVISICPYCAVCCQVVAFVRDGKLIAIEGDADFPVTRGALCAKGASLLGMYTAKPRLAKPLYRAPFSDKWEEKDWDWTLEQICRRVKDARDKNFVVKNDKGQTVNRFENIFMMGTSHASNEECAVMHQGLRSLGIVYMDHQART